MDSRCTIWSVTTTSTTRRTGRKTATARNHNDSWNCGEEGPTAIPEINALRLRQKRNFLATLLLSQGVPMLLAGDEFGHSQQGNNNAYCQDSPIAWLDWNLSAEQREQLEFVRLLLRLRKSQPVFRRRRFFQGRPVHGQDIKDIYWLTPDGTQMTGSDWNADHVRCLGLGLAGVQIDETDAHGQRIVGENYLILFNAGHEPRPFRLHPARANAALDLRVRHGRSPGDGEGAGLSDGVPAAGAFGGGAAAGVCGVIQNFDGTPAEGSNGINGIAEGSFGQD
jgi:pullulanase/glycogen debranching enzyme